MIKTDNKQLNIETAKKICKLYKQNEYTIESCCKKNGLSYDTFYTWIGNKKGAIKEVKDIYKNAKKEKRERKNGRLIKLARTALEKKLSFWTYTETETSTEKTVHGERTKEKKTKKRVIPTAGDIALALNNLDADFDPSSAGNESWTDRMTIYGLKKGAI